MKKNFWVLGSLALIVAIMIGGCKKPDEEMKRAMAAIEEAKKAGAGEYASGDLASAEQLLAEGRELMRQYRYAEAKAKFEEAYRLALSAKGKATSQQGGPGEPKPGGSTPIGKDGSPLPTSHTVVKGECLWRIAEYDQMYDDPFQWPLIYQANRDNIDKTAHQHGFRSNEENWIFPDQQFGIPRDASTDEIKAARKRAGAPAPYMPPGK
jgi:nucleoid-associated protein YgaU